MKRLILYSCLLLVLAACSGEPADSQHVIGFYNLENLFDTVDDPQKNDEDFLPDGRNSWTEDKYQEKLANMAQVIDAMADRNGRYHTVLGVCEVENRKVLEDLVAQEDIAGAGFEVVHHEWPEGLGDPSGFPALLDALRRRGYSESTLEGLAGLNLWYLLKKAEREAKIK